MMFASANTDPAAFGPDADRFDITATRPATALTFGAGIHHCLGSVLARIDMAEALKVLAERLGPMTPDGEPGHRPALGITGPMDLPIRFGRIGSAAGPVLAVRAALLPYVDRSTTKAILQFTL
jgi:cytochrome P450